MRLLALSLIVLGLGVIACSSAESTGEVSLEPWATIRGLGDSVDVAAFPAPAISRDGRLIAVTRMETPSNLIALFDSDGRYLRTVGRPGRGPGEIANLQSFGFGPGDSLWVTDNRIRAHVFTPPPEMEYVRTLSLGQPSLFQVSAHGFVMPSIVRYDGRGSTLTQPQLLGFDGTSRATYGPSLEGEGYEGRMGPVDVIDWDSAWVARRGEYAVELLGGDGTVKRRLTRDVDWFPFDTTAWDRKSKPPPAIQDVVMGDDGILWVLLRRARPDWEANIGDLPQIRAPVEARAMRGFRSVAHLYEGVIEALDATTGRLLASRVVSGNVLGFVQPGVVYEQVEDADGLVTLVLSRLALAR